jgi:hypothetical protein
MWEVKELLELKIVEVILYDPSTYMHPGSNSITVRLADIEGDEYIQIIQGTSIITLDFATSKELIKAINVLTT